MSNLPNQISQAAAETTRHSASSGSPAEIKMPPNRVIWLIDAVAREYNKMPGWVSVNREDLLRFDKRPHVVEPRLVAMHLAATLLEGHPILTPANIGRFFKRDRQIILDAKKAIEQILCSKDDPELTAVDKTEKRARVGKIIETVTSAFHEKFGENPAANLSVAKSGVTDRPAEAPEPAERTAPGTAPATRTLP